MKARVCAKGLMRRFPQRGKRKTKTKIKMHVPVKRLCHPLSGEGQGAAPPPQPTCGPGGLAAAWHLAGRASPGCTCRSLPGTWLPSEPHRLPPAHGQPASLAPTPGWPHAERLPEAPGPMASATVGSEPGWATRSLQCESGTRDWVVYHPQFCRSRQCRVPAPRCREIPGAMVVLAPQTSPIPKSSPCWFRGSSTGFSVL